MTKIWVRPSIVILSVRPDPNSFSIVIFVRLPIFLILIHPVIIIDYKFAMADKKKADIANEITDVSGTDGKGKKAHSSAFADKSPNVEE